jgi:hypothetical protein
VKCNLLTAATSRERLVCFGKHRLNFRQNTTTLKWKETLQERICAIGINPDHGNTFPEENQNWRKASYIFLNQNWRRLYFGLTIHNPQLVDCEFYVPLSLGGSHSVPHPLTGLFFVSFVLLTFGPSFDFLLPLAGCNDKSCSPLSVIFPGSGRSTCLDWTWLYYWHLFKSRML